MYGEDAGKYGARYNRITYNDNNGVHRGGTRIDGGGLLICYGMNIDGVGIFSSIGKATYYYEPGNKVNIEGGASGRRFS